MKGCYLRVRSVPRHADVRAQGEVARGEWANGAESGVTLRIAQRLLADDLNSTASTGEVIAKALEVNIRIERK